MSRITVRGFAGGLLKGLGHDPVLGVRDFSGELRFDLEAPEQAAINITVKAASLEVQNHASDKDCREMKRVMDEEVLEVATCPEIVFRSDKVAANRNGGFISAQVLGMLALHGVEHPLVIPVQATAMGDTLRAAGEFPLRQTDFRINPPSIAGGALKLRDELKITFALLARLTGEIESEEKPNVLSHSG